MNSLGFLYYLVLIFIRSLKSASNYVLFDEARIIVINNLIKFFTYNLLFIAIDTNIFNFGNDRHLGNVYEEIFNNNAGRNYAGSDRVFF